MCWRKIRCSLVHDKTMAARSESSWKGCSLSGQTLNGAQNERKTYFSSAHLPQKTARPPPKQHETQFISSSSCFALLFLSAEARLRRLKHNRLRSIIDESRRETQNKLNWFAITINKDKKIIVRKIKTEMKPATLFHNDWRAQNEMF